MSSSQAISSMLNHLSNPFPNQVTRKRKYNEEYTDKNNPIEKRVQNKALDSLSLLSDPSCSSRPPYQLSSKAHIEVSIGKEVTSEDRAKKTEPQSTPLLQSPNGRMIPPSLINGGIDNLALFLEQTKQHLARNTSSLPSIESGGSVSSITHVQPHPTAEKREQIGVFKHQTVPKKQLPLHKDPKVTHSPKDSVYSPSTPLSFKLSSSTGSMHPLQIEAIHLFNTNTPLPLKQLGHRIRLLSLKAAKVAADSEDIALASKALCLDLTPFEKADLFKRWGYTSLMSTSEGDSIFLDSAIYYLEQALALNVLPAEITGQVHLDLGNAYLKKGDSASIDLAISQFLSALQLKTESDQRAQIYRILANTYMKRAQEGDKELASNAFIDGLKTASEPQLVGNLLIEYGNLMKDSETSILFSN